MRNPPDSQPFPEGLTEAYQCYRLELRTFFELNSRDKSAVDDLMQTMFLQLLKDRPAVEVRDPRQYLFRSAWNVLHNANQRAQRERNLFVSCDVAEFDQLADQSNRLWVEDDANSSVQRAELDRALAQLSRACQIAVLRQYRDNRTYKEIAEELGVTTHAVKKYVMRALNHFRIHLNGMDLSQEGKRS